MFRLGRSSRRNRILNSSPRRMRARPRADWPPKISLRRLDRNEWSWPRIGFNRPVAVVVVVVVANSGLRCFCPCKRTNRRKCNQNSIPHQAAGGVGGEVARLGRRSAPWATPAGAQDDSEGPLSESKAHSRAQLRPINELRVSGSKNEPPSRPTVDWSRQRPHFGPDIQRNVSVELGKTAYLTCKVLDLGDKTVSSRFRAPDGWRLDSNGPLVAPN